MTRHPRTAGHRSTQSPVNSRGSWACVEKACLPSTMCFGGHLLPLLSSPSRSIAMGGRVGQHVTPLCNHRNAETMLSSGCPQPMTEHDMDIDSGSFLLTWRSSNRCHWLRNSDLRLFWPCPSLPLHRYKATTVVWLLSLPTLDTLPLSLITFLRRSFAYTRLSWHLPLYRLKWTHRKIRKKWNQLDFIQPLIHSTSDQ